MVEEALVKDVLSQEMILAGKTFTLLLEQSELPVKASLWLYLTDKNLWRLIISSESVESKGPKYVYRKIQSLLKDSENKLGGLTLNDVSVVGPRSPLAVALGRFLRMDEVGGVRMSRNVINGHYVEDAYVYKLSAG